MSFGAKLKAYRKRAGISQYTLAVRIGLHTQSVYELERDEFKPQLGTFARIREALNLSPDETVDLLEEAKQPAKIGR